MSGLETIIIPPLRDLGDGFHVRRALPAAQRRAVGPFVFFDQMGPAHFNAGVGLDVRPHPHIGLATVTYLFDGEILHRDSLGNAQVIRPGEVNWMITGSGIVHSERTDSARRETTSTLFGLQCWVALPRAHEEVAASFQHHAASELPQVDGEGVTMRLIAGTLAGARSPVATLSSMFYADVMLKPGANMPVSTEHEERAIYVVEGEIAFEEQSVIAGQLSILRPQAPVVLHAAQGARIMLLGGAPLDGPRHLWWNFVSSSTERIEQAKDDWRAGRFGKVPGDTQFIPLPESAPARA